MKCIPIEFIEKDREYAETEQFLIFNQFPFEILAYIADIFALLLA